MSELSEDSSYSIDSAISESYDFYMSGPSQAERTELRLIGQSFAKELAPVRAHLKGVWLTRRTSEETGLSVHIVANLTDARSESEVYSAALRYSKKNPREDVAWRIRPYSPGAQISQIVPENAVKINVPSANSH